VYAGGLVSASIAASLAVITNYIERQYWCITKWVNRRGSEGKDSRMHQRRQVYPNEWNAIEGATCKRANLTSER